MSFSKRVPKYACKSSADGLQVLPSRRMTSNLSDRLLAPLVTTPCLHAISVELLEAGLLARPVTEA